MSVCSTASVSVFLKIHFYDPYTRKAIGTVPGPLGIDLHIQWLSSSRVIFLQENAVKAIKSNPDWQDWNDEHVGKCARFTICS